MPTVGSLSVGLYRRCTVPMSLSLSNASLRWRHALRARIPLAPYRTSSTTRSNSKFVVSGKPERFVTGISDFSRIRKPNSPYFDKTQYIPVLENSSHVQLLCRPRRFGKSLTVSMLRYFHGVEFRSKYDELFKGLDVDEAVQNGIVQPGRYLVLEFDFSRTQRSHSISESAEGLKMEINRGLEAFRHKYSKYLGPSFELETAGLNLKYPGPNLGKLVDAVEFALQNVHERGEKDNPLWDVLGIYVLADEYDAYANGCMDPHDPRQWSDAEPALILKSFWSSVKAGTALMHGIQKVYTTGITPLLLSDLFSGANNQQNISFDPEFSTICGLTRSDVLGALRIVCNNEEEVQKHLRELEHYANGYHFCQERSVDRVFNTQTALSYLESVTKGKIPRVKNPPNSEVSEHFLRICAKTPTAVNEMQFALQKDEHGSFQKTPYQDVHRSFGLSELSIQIGGESDKTAWQSFMVYMGGLTFDSAEPSKFLKIPNLVAAQRFGFALINRYGLYQTMRNALYELANSGNPMDVLSGYCHLMRQRDVGRDAFTKTEEHHRDSILITILENPAIQPAVEYEVRKSTKGKGFIDLSITNENCYTLIEFKNIQIPYLGLDGEDIFDKAKQLEAMELNQILGLKFKNDKWRTGISIRDWIDGKRKASISGTVRKQLQSYIAGETVQKEIVGKKIRAFAAVIIGSRHILVREMDRHGEWVGEFRLAEWKGSPSVIN